MNERIKELAEQAGFNHMGIWNTIGIWEYHKKFAELIVRECAQVCRDQSTEYALPLDRENCASAIEEHFGVE